MKNIITYWQRDKSRLIGFFLISISIVVSSFFTLDKNYKDIWRISIILIALYFLHIFHSSFLKGRAFQESENKYLLVNLYKRNSNGNRSVLYSTVLILVMQFQIFYTCFLILLWFSCLFYSFEHAVNKGIQSYFDALYVIIISATTIGFGDIPPYTAQGKILAILSSFLGILILGVVSASSWHAIQSTYVIFRDGRSHKKHESKI